MTQSIKRDETRPETVDTRSWEAPPVDIYENDDELLLIADLPGVAPDQLKVNLESDQLILEGHRSPAIERTALRHESPSWDYRRSFTIPRIFDAGKVTAELKDGVLTLHLTKGQAAKPRQIPVTAG
jgi:HSP20 family protein